MITQESLTSKQTAYQAQLAQRKAHNAALNGGNIDAPFAADVLRNVDPALYPPSPSFLKSIAETIITEARRGDPSNLVAGLLKTYRRRVAR